MTLGNAQIRLGIAYHGESFLGTNLMVTVLHTNVLKRELLLVYGCWSQQCRFDSLLEP